MCPIYLAGPRWPEQPGDPRRYGDEIAEAATWDNLERMISMRVVDECPVGHWVYHATHRWPAVNGEKAGEVIKSVTDEGELEKLRRVGFCVRVDSHDTEETPAAKPKRGRPRGSKNKNRMS